ncbi:hypothetical protein AXF42_Ash005763 [Apostasia shenzhenica]|uniref:Uncharacterized protein n=1 Tax=Apostasia shenzhenica TaxID=1088818 RepID=A0A2I0BCC2_9ASPA|nr:hypothetical protein AXF42_Ash005763 [Apostasia shenzhenica]
MFSGNSLKKFIHSSSVNPDDNETNVNFEDITCPICLDFPHNAVLLQCTSYDNGCRPFLCDTDDTHSNCLTRFKIAFGVPHSAESFTTNELSGTNSQPACPLCRGDVTGWVIIKEARAFLNMKKRCCQEKHCSYIGNFMELQCHIQLKHPHSRPSAIDPARKLDWENFQQSSDIIDVLSTIHAEVPHGVVLGDYVIEYGDEEDADGYDDFNHGKAKWWNSCIFHQMIDKFTCSGNRRRSRGTNRRQSRQGLSSVESNEGSLSSVEPAVYRLQEMQEEFQGIAAASHLEMASRGVIDRHSHRYHRRRSARRDN